MKSIHRLLFPLLALAAIALSFAGVALAREMSERDFFNVSEREIEITGVVESFDGSTLVINGKTIVVPVSAEVKGEIAVGQVVKVHALVGENDTLTAREIEPAMPGVNGDDDLDDDSANINSNDDLNDDLDDDSANFNGDDDMDDDLDDDSANINGDDDLDDDLDDDSANINGDDDDLFDDVDDDHGANINGDDDDDDNSANINADDDDDNSNSGHDDDDDDNSNSGNDDDDNDNSGHDDDDDDNDNSGRGDDDDDD